MKRKLPKMMVTSYAIASALILSTASAHAADEYLTPEERSFQERRNENTYDTFSRGQPHIGAIGGISGLPGDNTGGLLGVDVGFQAVDAISLGANFAMAGMAQDYERMTLFGKAAYNFSGDLPVIRYSFLGANVGWIRDSVEIFPGFEATDNYLGVGPVFGFDQPFSRYWTGGLEAKYIFNFEDETPNSLVVLAAVKYWL